jgi:hypothetical protein
MKADDPNLDLLLLDILNGYSKIKYDNKSFYFRHFLIFEELKLSQFEIDSFDSAIKNGIKSENDLLGNAIKRGFWSEEEDSSIKNLKWLIENSEKAISKVSDHAIKKSMMNSLDKDKEKLSELEGRKLSIVRHSAENLASRKKQSKTLQDNIYVDEDLTEHVDKDYLFYLVPVIGNKIEEINNKNNMLKMAYSQFFFETFALMYRDPLKMINKDLYNMSIWQKNLLSYASALFNKVRNLDMPDDVREDALKVYNFTPKEEDPSKEKVTHGVSDLREKMSQKGGKLTAEDF